MSRYTRGWSWEMPKMCALVSRGSKADPVYVNPLAVFYVRPIAPDRTAVYFSEDRSVEVTMPIEEVIRLLDIAMNVNHA
jgi:hypothetical protein